VDLRLVLTKLYNYMQAANFCYLDSTKTVGASFERGTLLKQTA